MSVLRAQLEVIGAKQPDSDSESASGAVPVNTENSVETTGRASVATPSLPVS